MTSSFTCITCRVAFRDLELQKKHYKYDWHRYNLKRKVAELPPVTSEEFHNRLFAQLNKTFKLPDIQYCNICRKKFNTKNQYYNHLTSKKHKENSFIMQESNSRELSQESDENSSSFSMKNIEKTVIEERKNASIVTDIETDTILTDIILTESETDSDTESVDSDEWIEDMEISMKNNYCLFCNHHSRSLMRNLTHMTVVHSFFIPDPEYCVDIKGLLTYLREKIFAGYKCIWCNTSGKTFYSADAARSHMLDKGHCKMLHEGEALAEYTEFYDYSSSYPEVENNDNPDAEVELPIVLDDNDYQLTLPSGNVIGHRALMRYYKQKLNPNKAVVVSKNEKLHKVLLKYKALGWTNSQKEVIERKARDIKYMQKVQTKYSVKLQIKANKLQHHFRNQVMF